MRTFVKKKLLLLSCLGIIFAGCSSGNNADETTTADPGITISGILGGLGGQSFQKAGDFGTLDLSFDDMEIYAICFSTPPAIGQANVAADGSFTVNLACPAGSFVSALFRYKSSYEEVGTIVFKDTSKTDMNGDAKESTSIALTGTVSLGSITLGSDGKVTVDVTTIASNVSSDDSATGTPFDFHGVWTAAAYDSTIPSGYVTACAVGSQNCHGPEEGMPISLIRLAGKEFTAANGACLKSNGELSGGCASTDGTIGTADKFAISIWGGDASASGSSAGIGACGYKLGFTGDEARAFGGLHLDAAPTLGGNQLLLQNFSFETATGFGGDGPTCTGDAQYCNQPWMKTGAQASWNMQDCSLVSLTGSNSAVYKAFACKVNAHSGSISGPTAEKYSAHLSDGGGCFDANNKPIRVDNWGSITPSSCTNSDHSALSNFQIGSCSYVNQVPVSGAAATNFTCKWAGGKSTFTNASLTTLETTYTYWNQNDMVNLVSAGGYCKNIPVASDSNILMKYRCYASNYWGGGGGSDFGSCSREYRFNWETTVPADFVVNAGRERPKAAFITDIAQYATDGESFTVNNKESEQASVFANGQNIICNVEKSVIINASKITDAKLLIDVQEKGRVMDIDKPACRAVADCIGKLIKADVDAGGDGVISEESIRTGCGGSGDLAYRLVPNKLLFYMNKAQ